MTLLLAFAIIFCTCETRRTDLGPFNTKVQSEADKSLEQLTKVFDGLSVKQNKLETEIYDLGNTILKLQNEFETENQALKRSLLGIQNENGNMKTILTKLKTKLSSKTRKPTETTQPSDATTPIEPTTPKEPAPPTTEPPTTTTESTPTTSSFLHSCDEGWKKFNYHCNLVVDEGKVWDDASSFCENRTSYLIEITTHEEAKFAVELILDYPGIIRFWTGATDRDIEGTFVYQHGKQQVPEYYWRSGEPDNYNGYEHCVAIRRNYRDLELYDKNCYWTGYFVCEKNITSS